MRRPVVPLLAASAALALVLAGCAGDGNADSDGSNQASPDCTPTASGAGSDAIEVTGEFGEQPTVTFDAPLTVEETQRTVITEGDGALIEAGANADVSFTIVSATTGEQLAATEVTTIPVDDAQIVPGIIRAVECSTVGSRVATVATAADMFGEQGNPQLGVGPNEAVVIVMDVVEPPEPAVPGEWTDAPDVTFDDAGVPTVDISGLETPTDLLLTVLEEGDGDVIDRDDTVSVRYQGTSWDTGEIFDENFTTDPVSFPVTGVVEGFGAALTGQAVGSTVMVTMPPALAYGEDPEAAPLGGQSLLFVVEILGIDS